MVRAAVVAGIQWLGEWLGLGQRDNAVMNKYVRLKHINQYKEECRGVRRFQMLLQCLVGYSNADTVQALYTTVGDEGATGTQLLLLWSGNYSLLPWKLQKTTAVMINTIADEFIPGYLRVSGKYRYNRVQETLTHALQVPAQLRIRSHQIHTVSPGSVVHAHLQRNAQYRYSCSQLNSGGGING